MDEIIIPGKFKEKITQQDSKEQKKTKLDVLKFKAEAKILEGRAIHYKTKYQEFDRELMTEIGELCPTNTQQFQSTRWERNCTREIKKNKMKTSSTKKTAWLKIVFFTLHTYARKLNQISKEIPIMLDPWEIRSTTSLPSLPGQLWFRVGAPDRVQSNRTGWHLNYVQTNDLC